MTVKEELRSIMHPEYSGYSRHATTPRRGKGKHRASPGVLPKAKRVLLFKNVNILKYMEASPREFRRSEKDIITFFYELSPYCCGDDILDEIVKILKQSKVESYDFTSLATSDIEFVKCTGKVCRVPQTASDFAWSTEAVRSLAGKGDIYLRLTRSFVEDLDAMDEPSPLPSTSTVSPELQVDHASNSNSSSSTPAAQASVSSSSIASDVPIDLTDPHPISDEEFPPFPPTTEVVSKERLHEIFSQLPTAAVEDIVTLCGGDTSQALKILLGGPNVPDLLQLLRRKYLAFRPKKLTIVEEEELVHEALVYYKHPTFNPLVPVRVSFEGQPAIDTGGVTRQFFTDVLCQLAKGELQLFNGLPNRLRLAYGPQVLPLMKILGTIIAHSLLHEGPGFPYFAPFVYWYLVTGCEERALPYVSIRDDLSLSCIQIVKKVSVAYFHARLPQIQFVTRLHLFTVLGKIPMKADMHVNLIVGPWCICIGDICTCLFQTFRNVL
jgi:hypothetical protein